MKNGKMKVIIITLIVAAGILMAMLSINGLVINTKAAETSGYNESYRNQLTFSALEGWNNDPNGLLYVNGVYHMYYQYNYDQRTDNTYNVWGNMSWGHATSTDLVHWTEQPVAIPAYQTVNGEYYDMMFSGSAVYDEYNTSGLFDVDADGKVQAGQGIVVLLTQPQTAEQGGAQRQILAYSKDNGQSFNIYGEILGRQDDGGMGDNEFRDPKAFWSEEHQKWLMAVGGGRVRMYSSDNLLDWEFVGNTDYWGECPDISAYNVDGETKYVLALSPEDKWQSHYYNKTTRNETFYPAEYYVVGDLNEKGLFEGESELKRLSYGIDSYAVQTFNNVPDGKVYGVSWSASWKSVGEYEKLRKTHNGGMTLTCEFNLTKSGDEYTLVRTPVSGYNELKGDVIGEYNDVVTADKPAFTDVKAQMYDMEVELDFSEGNATYAEFELRSSSAEKTVFRYDIKTQMITFDRSQGSLIAKDTNYFCLPTYMPVKLENNKLNVRVISDRAFLSVFINGQSLFAAIFPSAVSNGMAIKGDGVRVSGTVWELSGIYGDPNPVDELILTSNKFDMAIGDNTPLIASSYSSLFNENNVTFNVIEGNENISISGEGSIRNITAKSKGFSKIEVKYGEFTEYVEVYIYDNGYIGDLEYEYKLFGYTRPDDDGKIITRMDGDAFMFSAQKAEDFEYSADISVKDNGQAAGLVFGVSDNFYYYFVATADFKDNIIKIWRSDIGDVASVPYNFNGRLSCRMTLKVTNGVACLRIDNANIDNIRIKLDEYYGGMLGFNVYKAEGLINNVSLKNLMGTETTSAEFNGSNDVIVDFSTVNVIKVVNMTDNSHRLTEEEHSIQDGVITIYATYLNTLSAGSDYIFRIVTDERDYNLTVTVNFESAKVSANAPEFTIGSDVLLNISGCNVVYGISIDGKPIDSSMYKINDGVITLSKNYELINGTYTLTVYTDKGRPEITIVIAEPYNESPAEEPTSYLFFIIDITIFLVFIAGYITYSFLSKRKNKAK